MGLKEYNYSPTQLLEATAVRHPILGPMECSIGMALDTLVYLSEIGKEFDGDCDGIDALCYHLSGSQCSEAIRALRKVLERFEEIK